MAEALPEYPDSDFSDDDDVSQLSISFNNAADLVRKLTSKLDNNQLLELYGLYKQGTEGKCNTPKPGWFDAKGRKKWEAWRTLGDLGSDDAKKQYIELVQKYAPEFIEECSVSDAPKEAWVAVSSLLKTSEPELVQNELTLLDAARENCAEQVAILLAENPELRDERDEGGLTALHWAADRNATEALQAALDGGCPVDMTDDCGQTALHYAASCGHIESTKILINAGASLLKDEEDCTPFDLAMDNDIRVILEGAQ